MHVPTGNTLRLLSRFVGVHGGGASTMVVAASVSRRPKGCHRYAAAASVAATEITTALQPHEPERVQSISVHKGLKIQAALCVERPPTRIVEPDFKRRWHAYKEAWEMRTSNHLTIQDEIVFMRFHFHFLGDKAAQQALAGSAPARIPSGGGRGRSPDGRVEEQLEEVASSEAAVSGRLAEALASRSDLGGLDALLAGEGLDLAFPQQRRRGAARRQRALRSQAEVQGEDTARSLRRLGERSLFLLVQYRGAGSWTFPKVDRVHGQAMREALLRLCTRQLGPQFAPYIVGACPFAHRKLKSDRHPGIKGRKIFYYRARLVPGMDLALPSDSPVADWVWCSRDELPHYLGTGEWCIVRDGLPIDDVAV